MKCTSVDGELTESFEMFCKVLSYCWSTMDTSLLESTRLASPDMSTGVPYKIRILKEAVGFDLLPLAKPHNYRTESFLEGRYPEENVRQISMD